MVGYGLQLPSCCRGQPGSGTSERELNGFPSEVGISMVVSSSWDPEPLACTGSVPAVCVGLVACLRCAWAGWRVVSTAHLGGHAMAQQGSDVCRLQQQRQVRRVGGRAVRVVAVGALPDGKGAEVEGRLRDAVGQQMRKELLHDPKAMAHQARRLARAARALDAQTTEAVWARAKAAALDALGLRRWVHQWPGTWLCMSIHSHTLRVHRRPGVRRRACRRSTAAVTTGLAAARGGRALPRADAHHDDVIVVVIGFDGAAKVPKPLALGNLARLALPQYLQCRTKRGHGVGRGCVR